MYKMSLALLCGFVLWASTQAISQSPAQESTQLRAEDADCPRCREPSLEQEFGEVGDELELAYLDGFAIPLQNSPESRGYIVVYGGRLGKRGEVRARGERIKKYLVENRGLNADRLVVTHGGFRAKLTIQLWLRQPDACPPTPTPTVAPEDVRFKGKVESLWYLP